MKERAGMEEGEVIVGSEMVLDVAKDGTSLEEEIASV